MDGRAYSNRLFETSIRTCQSASFSRAEDPAMRAQRALIPWCMLSATGCKSFGAKRPRDLAKGAFNLPHGREPLKRTNSARALADKEVSGDLSRDIGPYAYAVGRRLDFT